MQLKREMIGLWFLADDTDTGKGGVFVKSREHCEELIV